MIERLRKKAEEILKKIPENKRPALICATGIAVMLIIVLPGLFGSEKTDKKSEKSTDEQSEYINSVENSLCSLISSIDGAGKTKIMLTLDSSEENVYASDINADKNEYVVIKENSEEGGMLLKVIKPKIRGVAVVCEGGDNPRVKIDITNAVCTALGINSTRISIAKMKDRSE